MKAGIFYFTTSGNTEEMAKALQEGFEAKGCETVLKHVDDAQSADIEGCDVICLGSPAQGTEEMDESSFMPFYNEHKDEIKKAPVFLFGSFGWGGGEYMENFGSEIEGEGVTVKGIYTHLEAPDDSTLEELKAKAAELC